VRLAIARARELPLSAAALAATVALLAADVMAGGSGSESEAPAIALVAILVALVAVRVAASWSRLVCGMVLVVLLIPSDGRYTLAGGLPFQLEPYRIAVGLLIIGWIIALLVDPRVEARATKFEAPLMLIVLATVGSVLFNPTRVGGHTSYVVKAMWLFACFILFVYLTVSVVRTRAVLERVLTVLVVAGCIEGIGAVLQRKTGTNIFDKLHVLLPMFSYNPGAILSTLVRGGAIRATASAGHPIELSSTMAMLLPIAIYLAVSRKQKGWWVAALILLAGDFAGGSRTGVIGIAVIVLVFLCLRPRQVLRCWPALIPTLVVVHFLLPGALGGVTGALFPSGGLLKQQTQTFVGRGGVVDETSRLSRLGPSLHEFSQHNPLFGEGYGTRVVGNLANGQPNPADNAQVLDDQWLGTLLETGILGIVGWLWLFARVIRRLAARSKLERGSPEGWLPVALAGSVGAFASSMATYDAFGFTQATFLMFTLVALAAVTLLLPPVGRARVAQVGMGRVAQP
jgi:hypothetical protein